MNGEKHMKTKYENKTTGTVTEDRKVAVQWFESGIDVVVWVFSTFLEEWIEEMIWRS